MARKNFIQVKNLQDLKRLIGEKNKHDFFIMLNYGLRSSKFIDYDYDTGMFYVMNEIDGSEQTLSEKEIMDEDFTNIGKALDYGALYAYNY